MEKIKWSNSSVIFKLDKDDKLFSNDFFKFYFNDNLLTESFIIEILDKETVKINGNFSEGIRLKVNDIFYPFHLISDAGVKPKNEKEIYELEDDELEIPKLLDINVEEETITIENLLPLIEKIQIGSTTDYHLIKPELELKVHYFTDENFPDYPHKKDKLKIKDKLIITKETNLIYKFVIDKTKEIIVKAFPRYYWSNVKDLKEFLKDMDFEYEEKDDERLKRYIKEKSTYLKRHFGLLPMHIEDIEFFPAYKRLVNLYVLESLMSLHFINGTNDTSSPNVTRDTGNSLKLGNFATDGEGGRDGKVFGPAMIKQMILEAEKELLASLTRKHGIAKKLTFEGRCLNHDRLFFKVQRSFFDR